MTTFVSVDPPPCPITAARPDVNCVSHFSGPNVVSFCDIPSESRVCLETYGGAHNVARRPINATVMSSGQLYPTVSS
ncbi:hypothetical protein E2C01_014959 [Portunus trituberculatus]|uniref:Uncharacterized protein n=1 Tax=Portunus trituberculatus TaxID=210409 RepID=A0A5B7DLA7_PORTR|nr:hypothetical protein [Portunus trituberculatus]